MSVLAPGNAVIFNLFMANTDLIFLMSSAVNTDVNRVGQTNGDTGAGRDALRLGGGDQQQQGDQISQMQAAAAGQHMMSPGEDHMRQQTSHSGHTGDQNTDMRQQQER